METRNEIRKRMITVAARSWGLSMKEMESIDPVVLLLIDACAAELEKLSVNVDEAGQRMAIKLMEMLSPETLLNPLPSHAIIHAEPFEEEAVIDETRSFYYYRPNPFDEEESDVELFFTPVAPHKLFKGRVEYIATDNALYQIDEFNERSLVSKSRTRKAASGTLMLGVSLKKSIRSLKDMSFYFDASQLNDLQEQIFFQALKNSQWEIYGQRVETILGYPEGDIAWNDNLNMPLREFNRSLSVCRQVLGFYKKNFVSFSHAHWDDITGLNTYRAFPEHFMTLYDEEALKKMSDKLLWITVRFLPHIPGDILDNIQCSLNCFPVINRRREKSSISGFERIKELRARPYEMFFDLEEVACDEGLEVVIGDTPPADMEGKVLLTLRKDNIGRFSTMDALDKINEMIDAYHNEYAAFSRIKEIDHEALEKLNDSIKPFEVAVDSIKSYMSGTAPYIMLKTDEESEDVEVEVSYFLTCGRLANGIQRYTHMNYDSTELLKDKVFLLTTTMGGSDHVKDDDLVRKFRFMLLTRGKIVTLEDVRAASAAHFGDHASKIEVRKGVSMEASYHSGLQMVIEIIVHINGDSKLHEAEIKFLKDGLEQVLMENSTNVLPFKVICEQGISV